MDNCARARWWISCRKVSFAVVRPGTSSGAGAESIRMLSAPGEPMTGGVAARGVAATEPDPVGEAEMRLVPPEPGAAWSRGAAAAIAATIARKTTRRTRGTEDFMDGRLYRRRPAAMPTSGNGPAGPTSAEAGR